MMRKNEELIRWPDGEWLEWEPWADSALFTEDSILNVGELVEPTWVLNSGATHRRTARRELLRRPQACGTEGVWPCG
jgi:hypothetical protein